MTPSNGCCAPSSACVDARTGAGTVAGSYMVSYGEGARYGGCGRKYERGTNHGLLRAVAASRCSITRWGRNAVCESAAAYFGRHGDSGDASYANGIHSSGTATPRLRSQASQSSGAVSGRWHTGSKPGSTPSYEYRRGSSVGTVRGSTPLSV